MHACVGVCVGFVQGACSWWLVRGHACMCFYEWAIEQGVCSLWLLQSDTCMCLFFCCMLTVIAAMRCMRITVVLLFSREASLCSWSQPSFTSLWRSRSRSRSWSRYGHGHGVFILATSLTGKWTTDPVGHGYGHGPWHSHGMFIVATSGMISFLKIKGDDQWIKSVERSSV